MVDRETSKIFQKLLTAWGGITTAIERLNGSASVRPSDLRAVLSATNSRDSELVSFDMKPVVFQLPERGSVASADLYVVVCGRLEFGRAEFRDRSVLLTRSFATKVAYFVRKGSTLRHVYGAHYDFALDELGHPAFHGQMRSFEELATHIAEHFRVNHTVDDRVKDVLRTVRTPSAQLDVFSVFLQLCADHLLHKESAADEKAAFNALLKESAFCSGAAPLMPRLVTEDARKCYRARHWYPSIA